MSREFERKKRDSLLEEEDWDSLLEDDDGFDAAIKEEYMKEAEEIERSLFSEGIPRDSTDSEEEMQASYEKLVELMKAKGIYREDAADSAGVDDISADTALAAEADGDIGDFAGNALAFVSGEGEAAGIRMAAQPDSARKSTRRAMLRQFKMVRAAEVAAACLLGVFLVTMTSEANREYVVHTFQYLVGSDSHIMVDTDENNDEPLQDESEARKEIEKEIGVKVPVIIYYPDDFEYYDYYIRDNVKTATIEYSYNDNIIAFYISDNGNYSSSRSYGSQGDDRETFYINDGDISIGITKMVDEGEPEATYTAQWERENAVYQFSGRIEKDVLMKIIESLEY